MTDVTDATDGGARHADPGHPASSRTRFATVLVVWLAGLGTGLFAILAAVVRFGGCSGNGLACRDSGTTVAVALLVAVVATVTAVTVVTFGRTPQRILLVGAVGLVVLAALFVASRELLATA